MQPESLCSQPKLVDAEELAALWNLRVTWIREYTRSRAIDKIPHFKLGKYTKFDPSDPALTEWLERRRKGSPLPDKRSVKSSISNRTAS